MKSERRHDLKTNALARSLWGFPEYWHEYGNKALLALICMLLAFLGVRYWNDKKQQEAHKLQDAVQSAHDAIEQISIEPNLYERAPASALMKQRQTLRQDAEDAIGTILDSTNDPKLRTNAYLAKGELYWKLANMPELPGAATQPDLQLGSSERQRLLDQSRSAYEQGLSSNDSFDQFSARLALAAIAEDLDQWDTARQQYQQIAAAQDMPSEFKQYADQRLAELIRYEKPVLLEAPATEPTVFGPPVPASSEQASTATGSSEPATAPSASPATTQPTSSTPASKPSPSNPTR